MIPVRNLTIPNVLQAHARNIPSQECVVSPRRTATWRDFMESCNRVANGLRALGLARGDRVALLFDNSLELLELIVGVVIAGGVVVPLSGLMTKDVIARMLQSSGSRFVFVAGDLLGAFETVPDLARANRFTTGKSGDWNDYEIWKSRSSDKICPADHSNEDSISILYTSGTTGVPKGMEHSHLSRLLYPLVLGPLLRIDQAARTILVTPMYHNGTWTTMLPTLYSGGTVVITERFSVKQFQATVQREQCTHAFMVPTQLIVLASDPDFDAEQLRSIKVIMVSGAPLPTDTLLQLRSDLAHLEIREIYGMGEGFMTIAETQSPSLDGVRSVGRPIAEADTDIQIIDENDRSLPKGEIGEIVGTSAFMLKGYHGQPELTRRSLWFDGDGRAYIRSGDLGRFDNNGHLYLVGRKKDMIISGGVKIYATDLEDVFVSHPDVLEVAVIAIPHEKWGETPLMLAIPKPSARISEDELKEWGNSRLGKAQRVSRVEFRTSFPRNALDKIVKRELRDPYWTNAN